MNIADKIKYFLQSGESRTVEFKTSFNRDVIEAYPELTFSVEEMGGGVLVTFKQNEGVNALFNYILQQPGLRLPEMSEQLQGPVKTLERWIKQLRDENRVVFKGFSKTGGYYANSAGVIP